jgi:hypothetical protein
MLSASETGGDQENIVYSGGVDANDFALGDFFSQPSNQNPSSISQDGPEGLQLMFSGDVSADTSIDYTGSAPGVLSPDTIAIT